MGAQEPGLAVQQGRFCQSGASSGLWCPDHLTCCAGDPPAGEGAVMDRAGGQGKAFCQGGVCGSPTPARHFLSQASLPLALLSENTGPVTRRGEVLVFGWGMTPFLSVLGR